MSGIKECTVTMTRAQRDAMLNNTRRAEESAQLAMQREQMVQNALNIANSQLSSLTQTLNNEIAGLHADMRQMAREHNQRFQQQAYEFNDSISDVNRRMEEQRVELENFIIQVRQQSEHNRQQLQTAIDNINAKMEARDSTHKQVAEFWISQIQAYCGDVEQYRHNLFAPGQMARMRSELDAILHNMYHEAYQAAMASARAAFGNVVDIKDRVASAEIEWSFYHSAFLQAFAEAKSNLAYYQDLKFEIQMEHGIETVDAKINFWTNNALRRLNEDLEKIEAKGNQLQEVPTEELIRLLYSLNQVNAQMEAAADEARVALISSQQRAEMANKLTNALAGCGWDFNNETDGVAYEGEQHNRPVHIKMSDGMDNEIVAIISPDVDMSNKLEIKFFSETNDEGRQRAWIDSMQDSLKEEGLNVSTPVCREGYERIPSDVNTLRDIRVTASGGAS